jgi:hypothetical protein
MAKKQARMRASRIARRSWSRRIATALAIASTALLGIALLQDAGGGGMASRKRTAETTAARQLRLALEPLRAVVAPAQRSAALEALRPRIEALSDAMTATLTQPAHQLFPDAANAAAELNMVEFEGILRASLITARGESIGVAWMAIDHLEPISDSEVALLMESSERSVQVAGLHIAHAHAPLPESLVGIAVGCMRSPDPTVRSLALSCLPLELDATHADAVLDLCEEQPEDAAALSLLGRVAPTQRGIDALLDRLRRADGDTLSRIQPALHRYSEAPAVRKALWESAADLGDIERGARAIHCLEIMGVTDAAPEGSAAWPSRLQLFLARRRIAAGEVAGIDALLTLAQSDADAESKDVETATEARRIVTKLAKLPSHATHEELRAWRAGLASLPREPLPEPLW